MSIRPAHLLTACLAAAAALWLLLHALAVAAAQPAQSAVVAAQSNAQPDGAGGKVDVIILLRPAADLTGVNRIANVEARRAAIISQLKAVAESSQVDLLAELAAAAKTGQAGNVRPFWIVNGVAASVNPELLPELSALPGVAEVTLDQRHEVFGEPAGPQPAAADFDFAGWAEAPAARSGQAANWSIDAIRAPAVWNLLGIDGQGITVAIVDTGVDWTHPALRHNYRGGQGAEAVHEGNWYSTVYPTQTAPIDLHGHGTHVAGTAVGRRGIGVAPGADWIAVGIADEYGRIRDSDVHAAFQWLLAPDGDPALAPDVVNNSWGASGEYPAFMEDVSVLEAAGIVAIFAAGNTGPAAGSINAPASYPGAISVAAVDSSGATAWFSSRGPSPLTAEPKPLLSAPGALILSAYPNDRYALMNGTSMATPHVTGVVALMLAAEPRLSPADVKSRLAAAAGNLVHDPARGWGTVDAYAAVAPLAPAGVMTGRVTTLSGAMISATITVTTSSGRVVTLATDPQGRYEIAATPGEYRLQAAAFGYSPSIAQRIEAIPGHVTAGAIVLHPLPAGNLALRLASSGTGESIAGNVVIATAGGQPVLQPTLQADGRYAIMLPAGEYHVEARVPGFRLATTDVTIAADQTQAIDLALEAGPRLLLVDSGAWQYRSQASYYVQALEDNGYFAERWAITNPYGPLPDQQHLSAYDAVLWSAPFDSPGYLGANDVITDYLGIGGRLLIAGQNVANYDGADGSMAVWWARQLEAKWLADSSADDPLAGAPGTSFAPLRLTLNGQDSANNQTAPDRVAPRNGSLTQSVLLYPDGTAAALLSRRCEPYRLLYYGFSLEGVTGRDQRAALMQTTLDVLLGPDDPQSALWQPARVSDFALGGDRPAYRATLRNLNPVLTQTFTIEAGGGWWPRSILSPTLTIAPCGAADTVLTLDVPPGLPPDTHHEVTLRARPAAGDGPAAAELPITHKTPGHVLIVDDDRFIQAESIYKEVLDQLGLAYDVWETGWPFDVRGSPPAEFLRAYPLVIWFTGYDWFQPLTAPEVTALTDYLEHGGRLFLSSQDFLYRHYATPLARDYLGVASYQESITPTLVFLDEQLGASPSLAGGQPLDYGAYQNYSDGVAPTASARPFLWHNQGAVAGLINSGLGATGRPWRAIFWAIPFETLPDDEQEEAMNTVLGSLSDFGDSLFTVDRRSGPATEPRVYSFSIVNSARAARRVWLTNTLPVSLTLYSAPADMNYDRAGRRLTWSDVLDAGEVKSFTYTAAPATGQSPGRIDNSAIISYAPLAAGGSIAPFDLLTITKTATTWIDAPDLSPSFLTARSTIYRATSPAGGLIPAHLITYTMVMRNQAGVATGPMSATLSLPQSLSPLEDSVMATQGTARVEAWRVIWQGALLPGEVVTATVSLTATVEVGGAYPAVAYLNDGVTAPLLRPVFYAPLPRLFYLPVTAGRP